LRVNATALAAALSLPAVVLYTLLTGEAIATLRSAFMAAVALGAMLVNRPFSLSASIAFAALVLLVQSPLALLDISFQLSFASVIALGFFAQRFSPAAPPKGASRLRRALGWLVRCLAASSVASLSTMPLVAHHFGEVTPVAPLGNLVLVPLVELAVLPCGLVGALLALFDPLLGAVPLWIAGLASRAALYGAEGFRRLAPIILVRYPNLLESAALVAGAGFLFYGLSRGTGPRARWLLSAFLAGSLAAGSLVVRDLRRKTADEMRVTFIDVGQGDSALLEGPGGFVMLVDGGGRYDDSFDTGARVVEPVLRARGIGRLDLVVLSHPHPDHLNGLLRVLARFEVGALWTSGDDGHNPKYRELLALAHQRGVATPLPAAFERHGIRVEPLGPWVGDVVARRRDWTRTTPRWWFGRAMRDTRCCSRETSGSTARPSWWRGGRRAWPSPAMLSRFPITAAENRRGTSSWRRCSPARRWSRWVNTTPSICPVLRPWPDTRHGAYACNARTWMERSRYPSMRKGTCR
jgi:competence protein ComEC